MIEELPDLPFRLIFRELSYEDRFSLRRACKKLKVLIDWQMSRNLFIFLRCYPYHETLFHTDERVYHADSCRITNFDRFISSSWKDLKRLRKLTFYFKGLYVLRNYPENIDVNPENVDVNPETLRNKAFFQETWNLEIDLEPLNFFEHAEHLEIKEAGKVFGQLRLKNLRILSVKTRRLSQFDLDCPALAAMCIAFGARPNLINNPHPLDHLSVKRPLFEGTRKYLRKLYGQCPNLSTIGFDYVAFMGITLWEVNTGRVSLPLLRVIRFERPWRYYQDFTGELIDLFVEYEKSIEPESLRIIYNEEHITLKQLASIVQLHEKFMAARDKSKNVYLKALERSKAIGCLFSSVSALELNESISLGAVLKLKKLERLCIFSGSPQIDEKLFRWMLTTWTKLKGLWIENPDWKIDQQHLEQMPCHWPNLCSLVLGEKPEDIKFVTEFKNLKELTIKFNLPKEETQHLMRNCPSLYFICFENTSTDLETALMARMGWLHETPLIDQRLISEEESSLCLITFDSIEQAIDHYYDHDLFKAFGST